MDSRSTSVYHLLVVVSEQARIVRAHQPEAAASDVSKFLPRRRVTWPEALEGLSPAPIHLPSSYE